MKQKLNNYLRFSLSLSKSILTLTAVRNLQYNMRFQMCRFHSAMTSSRT